MLPLAAVQSWALGSVLRRRFSIGRLFRMAREFGWISGAFVAMGLVVAMAFSQAHAADLHWVCADGDHFILDHGSAEGPGCTHGAGRWAEVSTAWWAIPTSAQGLADLLSAIILLWAVAWVVRMIGNSIRGKS